MKRRRTNKQTNIFDENYTLTNRKLNDKKKKYIYMK